jgi:membrane protease YdiL (CAAX protease family)
MTDLPAPGPSERILKRCLKARLITKGHRDQREPDAALRRRRNVVAGVSVAGAGLLGASLSTEPDSPQFYVLTLGVAGTWLVGGLRSGPLHLGRAPTDEHASRRPLIAPVATGAAAFAVFYGVALVARRIPMLNHAITGLLHYAHEGSTPAVLASTLANGIGEEVFFRGALFTAGEPRHPIPTSTAIYTLTATATRNPALVLASAVMGTLFAIQRHTTGGIQAPILTYVT